MRKLYNITTKIIDNQKDPKQDLDITLPIFGYIDFKHHYLKFNEGSVQISQTDYDFFNLTIKVFNYHCQISDIQFVKAQVEKNPENIKQYYYQFHDSKAIGSFMLYPHLIKFQIFPKSPIHGLTWHIHAIENLGYLDFNPIFTSIHAEVSGNPYIAIPDREEAIKREKERQEKNMEANGGNFESLVQMLQKMAPKKVPELIKNRQKNQQEFHSIKQKMFFDPKFTYKKKYSKFFKNQEQMMQIDNKEHIRYTLRQKIKQHAIHMQQGSKCRRCDAEGISYFVDIISGPGIIAHLACICNFCGSCIQEVKRDHPNNIYTPSSIPRNERKKLIQTKLAEYKDRYGIDE